MTLARPVAQGLVAGVDVGGSKIAVLIVDPDLRVQARHAIPTSIGAPGAAAEQIAGAVRATALEAGIDIGRVAAVGVGVPGRVDPVGGVVSLAVNLGWRWLPLRDELEAILDIPCAIENDVRAAAGGILERGVLGQVRDFVYLSVGTGISAGVVIDGTVHRGTRGLAGEIGHIVVDADGPRCPCGLVGCLETIAAGPAIARAAAEAIAQGRPTALGSAASPDAATVYATAAAGDAVAIEIVSRGGRAVARAIHALVMTYDIERVVLGGGVTGAGDGFLRPVLSELDAMRAASELAAEMLPPDIVEISADGREAGSWGAVSVARARASREEVVAREAMA
jgi:glucokinase